MPKQAVLPCRVTEECRQRLSSFLIILLALGVLGGVALIGLALYIRIRIRSKASLLEGYDFDQLPITLLTVGGVTVLFDLIAAKIASDISDSSRREKLRYVMLGMVVILSLVDTGLLVGGCMAFIQRSLLTKSLNNGLITAMREYKNDIKLKVEMDLVQMEFGCCGNNGYEDWFEIQWINDNYLNRQSIGRIGRDTESGEFTNDDTPFSCCHPRSVRPCIHHNVHDNAAHYRYDYELSYTIHRTGCKQRLMEYYNARLSNIGSGVMGLFSLQFIALLSAQYLNSSICNALDRGDPERTAKGWIFEECPLITLIKAIAGNFI
ncbi:photoreceptor outer segment membrane glycoprotein 2-like [Diadema setosum]|uniref:photoreceptor outer segment membrane glycoprotein 2-like n=1 Tax=Diadema setosum TaxID=31175 RepID=UPI003B3A1231